MPIQKSNNDVPNILVFRPTWEEFKDFNKYMKYVESVGAHRAGIAKIIPPKEWVPRKNGYDMEEIMKMKIPDPICQEMDGTKGIFQSLNVRKNALSVKEFHKKSQDKTYRTPTYTNFEDLERKYWKNVTFVSPIYGADVPGSITDNDCDVSTNCRRSEILKRPDQIELMKSKTQFHKKYFPLKMPS